MRQSIGNNTANLHLRALALLVRNRAMLFVIGASFTITIVLICIQGKPKDKTFYTAIMGTLMGTLTLLNYSSGSFEPNKKLPCKSLP